MIVMDESEYLNSPLSDRSLRLVALFNGPEVATKLLYRGDQDVRLHYKRIGSVLSLRTKSYSNSNGSICVPQDAEGEEEVTPIYTMAYSG